jgi:hypothetical protein
MREGSVEIKAERWTLGSNRDQWQIISIVAEEIGPWWSEAKGHEKK